MSKLGRYIVNLGSQYLGYTCTLRPASYVVVFLARLSSYLIVDDRADVQADYQATLRENSVFQFSALRFVYFTYMFNAFERLFISSGKKDLAKASASVKLTERSEEILYQNPIAHAEIFAAFHFSSYTTFIGGLSSVIDQDKPCHILLNNRDLADRLGDIFRTSKAILPNIDFTLIDNPRAFKRAIREFKMRGGILVCYADLCGKFGVCEDFNFLGKHARLTVGHLRLAQKYKVPVRTIYTTGSVNLGDATVHVSAPIAAEKGSDTDARSLGMGQRIVDSLTEAICAHPHQWRLWYDIEYYFQPSPTMRR